MRKTLITIIGIFISITSFSQSIETDRTYNLDFEHLVDGKPVGWKNFGKSNYIISIDSNILKKGKYSAYIELKEGDPTFKAWSFTIPENYNGNEITLSGYIKTENVTDGYAGLWMRIDPKIAFDNMNANGITGTTDWTKYEITLNMNPKKTKQFIIGGLLTGSGKMWIDDLSVTIDKKDIKDLEPIKRKIYPAEKDNEFDNGSQITNLVTTESQNKNLKKLGLIWGYLKYYHPNIFAGDYNMDYELFRVLPSVLNSKNDANCDSVFIDWIDKFGQFSKIKDLKIDSSNTKLTPDIDWITESGFSKELTTVLLNVKDAKRPKEHYYIELAQGVGNPEFKNEKPYSSMEYPDLGFRLLALYKYWNIIQYYFPYKNLIEEDWKNVLIEFIPKTIEAKNQTEYTLVLLELIGQIHDTHGNIWGGNAALKAFFGKNYAPFELTFIENVPVVTSYYDEIMGKESGMQIGDVITAINGRPIDEIIISSLKYTPASNYPTQLRDIAPKLLRTNDSTINIEFVRDNVNFEKTIKTFSTKEINIYSKFQVNDTCFKVIEDEIAYINNGSLKQEYLPKLWIEIENKKGLIIDIRNYPSDFPIYAFSEYLMPKKTPYVKFTNGSLTTPGLFTFTKTINVGKKNDDYYKGKVVIIINDISQSSAEFHAMAYRVNPNAIVIGSTTAGADGNVSEIYLPGGIRTMISGIGVYYPDGTETQRIGIIPDIEVQQTIKGIKNGKDELLEKAIEIIQVP